LKKIKLIWELLRPKHIFQYFVKITAWPFFTIFFAPKYFRENNASRIIKGNAVVISNHKGIYDPPIIFMTFFSNYLNMIAAESIFRNRLLALFFKGVGCIKIERGKIDTACFQESVKILKGGGVVCLFPEGRLNPTDELNGFRSSYILMALKGNAPIIPIYIGSKYSYFKRQKIIIGDAIYLNEFLKEGTLSLKTVEELNEIVYGKMLELGKLLKEKENTNG